MSLACCVPAGRIYECSIQSSASPEAKTTSAGAQSCCSHLPAAEVQPPHACQQPAFHLHYCQSQDGRLEFCQHIVSGAPRLYVSFVISWHRPDPEMQHDCMAGAAQHRHVSDTNQLYTALALLTASTLDKCGMHSSNEVVSAAILLSSTLQSCKPHSPGCQSDDC